MGVKGGDGCSPRAGLLATDQNVVGKLIPANTQQL